MSAPRAPHTRYGERRARAQTAEDWHRIGDHDEHGDAHCQLCIEQHWGHLKYPVEFRR